MSAMHGGRQDDRANALWGSRGGEVRSSALWGKGGRSLGLTLVALVAMALPLAAGAGDGKGGPNPAWISPGLQQQAAKDPSRTLHVIVRAEGGAAAAAKTLRGIGTVTKELGFVGAVAAEIPAARLNGLSRVPGIVVTGDAPVKLDGYSSKQLWPFQNGVSKLWGTDQNPAPKAPTIAIVDSGLEKRADFGSRVRAVVNLTPLTPNSPGDGRGHGTFVASLAAGEAPGYAGAAPNADLVMIDVMDDSGRARTSDVINAAAFIYAYRNQLGIRVANFSLHSTAVLPIAMHPLNVAVQKLWLSGIVVVTSAGNHGSADGPSGVPFSPGNDPFVITVGALDLNGTVGVGDDSHAPWSAYGRTPDGFWKPDICAAGRYMVAAMPADATLLAEKPDSAVEPGYMQLSGTSFAAPVVAGIAAQMLAYHPDWTPNQVKGALMQRARPVPNGTPWACGVGQVNALRSVHAVANPANPNLALGNHVVADPNDPGAYVFDAVSWDSATSGDVSWDSVSWTDVSWTDVSWDSVSWADVSWADVSWTDVSWTDVSWEDVVSWGDAAELEANGSGGYPLTEEELAAALADPDLLLPGEEPAVAEPAAAEEPASAPAETTEAPAGTDDGSSATAAG